MKKKLLIITSEFIPTGGAGVQRISKLCKYLDPEKFDITVYTKEHNKRKSVDNSIDNTILDKVTIFRTRSFFKSIRKTTTQLNTYNELNTNMTNVNNKAVILKSILKKSIMNILPFLNLPDTSILWAIINYPKVSKIISRHEIDIIMTTSPSQSNHLLGKMLKNKHRNILWVADFRDLWTQNVFVKYPSKFHVKLNRFMEERVIISADIITVVNNEMKSAILDRYQIDRKKVNVIYNGFDPDDFASQKPLHNNENSSSQIIISHIGSLYGQRSALNFLRALVVLNKETEDLEENLSVVLAGSIDTKTRAFIAENNLTNVVKATGYINHDEAISLMNTSNYLLLIPGPGKTTVTGKIFEYIYARKPIILLNDEATGAQIILEDLKLDKFSIKNEVSDIHTTLETILNNSHKFSLPEIDESCLKKYNRKYQASQFEKIMTQDKTFNI